jgi:alpha-galactosidase
LKPIEQQSHISLWAMLSAPLLIGCDLTKLDDFTRDLLCNDEVLAVNQDPLGKVAQRIAQDGSIEIWSRPLFDGTIAVAIFNRGTDDGRWTLKWSDVNLSGPQPIRDLWKHKDYGTFDANFAGTIPAHGSILLRIGKPKN